MSKDAPARIEALQQELEQLRKVLSGEMAKRKRKTCLRPLFHRPALVLAVHGEDVIVLGIFSRIPSGTLRKTWVKIEDGHPAFPQIGLKKTSLLKAEKIAVVHESVFQQKLGALPPDLRAQVQEALKRALLIP